MLEDGRLKGLVAAGAALSPKEETNGVDDAGATVLPKRPPPDPPKPSPPPNAGPVANGAEALCPKHPKELGNAEALVVLPNMLGVV